MPTMPIKLSYLKLLSLALMTVLVVTVAKAQDLSQVKAKAYLLIDAQTGEVLSQRNANQTYAPASTVKLMTALVVWEKIGLEGRIQVEPNDTRVEPSHIPLRVGETVSIRDMVHALLIGSDNDCAMVLARAAGGSLNSFLSVMNARAKSLGCQNTTFKNPHGLPAPGQYTTATDLMKIFQKVLSISELREICGIKNFRLTTQIGSQNIRNHNKLLGLYNGMGPAKTGWTVSSRHTYAAAAIRNGRELRLVILNSPNKWVDARLIFDFGFQKPARQMPPSDVILVETTPTTPARSVVLKTQIPANITKAPPIQLVGTAAPVSVTATAPEPSITEPRIKITPPRPAAVAAPIAATAPSLSTHTVRKGETLFSIGKTYRVKLPELLRVNALDNPDHIHPGLVLFIPSS